MHLLNLDAQTRSAALAEIARDEASPAGLYLGRTLNEAGSAAWPGLLKQHMQSGDPESLATALVDGEFFVAKDAKGSAVGPDAPRKLAEGQFNRFYMRGLCARAIEANFGIEVYRARESATPRPSSVVLVGQRPDPSHVLNELRLPPGSSKIELGQPHSGLSLRVAE